MGLPPFVQAILVLFAIIAVFVGLRIVRDRFGEAWGFGPDDEDPAGLEE